MVFPVLLAGLIGVLLGVGAALALWWRKRKDIEQLHDEKTALQVQLAKVDAAAARIPTLEQQLQAVQAQREALDRERIGLQAEITLQQKLLEERAQSIEETKSQMLQTFQSLSAEALYKTNAAFLDVAKGSMEHFHAQSKQEWEARHSSVSSLVAPIQQALEKVEHKLQENDKERVAAYEGLTQQVRFLTESSQDLKTQTARLVQSLRSPTVRGRWGEVQLRRIVELAGMSEFCDFDLQVTAQREEQRVRPDLVVRMPGKKSLVVDAKVPLEAFLKAIESTEEQQKKEHLSEHASHLRNHIRALAAKSYWEQFQDTPSFVVLFLPGDVFFQAAVQEDPSLVETGFRHNVVVATPSTLMALLRVVAHGWQEEKMNQTSQEIAKLGRELYERIYKFALHFQEVGKHLDRSVAAFNQTVGSFESRVLVTARKLQSLHAGTETRELATPAQIEQQTRVLTMADLAEK